MDDLEKLKKLAGIQDKGFFTDLGNSAAKNRIIEREQNIKPGTKEWFELWFKRDSGNGNMPAPFRGRVKK